MSKIDNTQMAFSVKQRRPRIVNEAIATIWEIESYLNPKARVDQVQATSQDWGIMEIVTQVMQRLDRLEKIQSEPRISPASGRRTS